MEAFALLPHTVKRDHPEVLALFSQNGVSVVDPDSEYPSLCAGAKNNRVELLELLLDEDGETYGSDTKSLGYLHVAVHTGNRRLAKLLFPRKIIVHPQAKLDLSNARLAIDEENGKFLEQLLANGNDVSYRRPEGGTFLHLVVEQCHESLLTSLVRVGADVNAAKRDGWTPLHIAADKGFVRMTERLLRSGSNVHAKLTANSQLKNATPLQLAVAKDHVDVARLLLASGSDVDAHSHTGQTVLQLAIERGCLGSVEQLLKHGPDVRNKSNYDAFRLALNETRPVYSDIVARLFDYGFSISSDDISNFAMLRGAVRLNCIPIVLKFLEHDVNLNDHERHGEIRSLLHVAVEHAAEEMVGLLLENGACIESNCYYLNRTPIFAAATKGRLENLKLLLRSGAKVDVKDIFGLTPLLASSENGHPGVVEALLDSGADVNVVCEKCRSAMFYAVTNGHARVAEVLSRFGASSNSRDRFGLTPLHVACTKGNSELVEILLRNDTDVNARCSRGRTALWLAAEKGFKEVIEQLLASDANVDCRAEGGMTPLHVVARLGSADIANVLLKNGADVNATCYKRRTPLFYAVIGGHFDVTESLLKLGADTDSKDVDHKTPLYAAAVEGTKSWTITTSGEEPHDTNVERSVVELLLRFGARLDFILRSKPVVFDLAVFSSTDVFKTILEFCFVESELFDEARLCELFDATRHLVYLGLKLVHFVKAGDVFAQHVVKVRALRAALRRDLPQPIWYCKDKSLDEFARDCEEELLRLRNENIGDTTIMLHDVLTKDSRKVAGFLRNDSIACILKNRGYRAEFPIYAGIIDCQFLKGNLQKELMRQCTRACHLFLSCFRTLPYDVKERILSYLSFADLKSLLRACRIPLVIV